MPDIFAVTLSMRGALGLFGTLGKSSSGLELAGAPTEAKSPNGGSEISFGFMPLSRQIALKSVALAVMGRRALNVSANPSFGERIVFTSASTLPISRAIIFA